MKSSTLDVALESINGKTMQISQKVYLCGFPKSGLHLAELMGRSVGGPLYKTDEDGQKVWNWLGSFDENAWSTNWLDFDNIAKKIAEQPQGTLRKGHTGYHPKIEQAFFENGFAFSFIYRDLRDVAVSQAFHVVSDRDGWKHPAKDHFKSLDTFEDVLLGVICGIDGFPGLLERWELYAPWLDVDWVFATNFEYMRLYPREAVDAFVRYVYHRTAVHHGFSVVLNEADVEARVDEAVGWMQGGIQTATFRKGAIGEWKEYFTPKVKQEFKARCGDWLHDLGYERNRDW